MVVLQLVLFITIIIYDIYHYFVYILQLL